MHPLMLAAAVAQAFNLSCAGTIVSNVTGPDLTESYSHVYRVDLDKHEWCEGDCKTIHSVAEIQPTRLFLESKKEFTQEGEHAVYNVIDRTDGTHSTIEYMKYGHFVRASGTGHCERQPFTGFPAFTTKF